MELKVMIKDYEYDSTKNLISVAQLAALQKIIGCKFGQMLKQYVLLYGYLGYKSVEFYGINSIQVEKSDMITQTIYLHKYYPQTNQLIAFENQGEGDYYLVDQNDKMFRFNSETAILKPLNIDLFDYILTRIKEAF